MRRPQSFPVLGTVYIVSVLVAGLHTTKGWHLGWVTTLAWWVVVVGALGFIAWVVVKLVVAARRGATS